MKNSKISVLIYSVAAILLAIPFVAMQFTDEVNWSPSDFLIAGILLFASAFGIDLILKKVKVDARRFVYVVLVLLALFLVWAELAVGIFGSPFAGS